MSARRVLVVTRHFAPSTAVGAKRFSFLAGELERRGYEVQVLTTDLPRDAVADPSLPLVASVHRCAPLVQLPLPRGRFGARLINRLARALLSPLDLDAPWIAPAAHLGATLVGNGGAGVVIATSPPFSAALAGTRIAVRRGWPLILDYRDPYTAYPGIRRLRHPAVRAIATTLERRCVRRSVARVFNTSEMQAHFERVFPEAPRDAHFIIPNGVSAVDLAWATRPPTEVQPAIVYAGTVYADRSLRPVLRALRELIARDPRFSDYRVIVHGEVPHDEVALARREGLHHLLEVRPRLTREELWPVLRGAALLLAMVGPRMAYSIPYKLYDYLAVGRPILVLAPPEAALWRLFTQQQVGVIADPADQEAVVNALRLQLGSASVGADPAVVQQYTWERLAGVYDQVIAYAATAHRERGSRPAVSRS